MFGCRYEGILICIRVCGENPCTDLERVNTGERRVSNGSRSMSWPDQSQLGTVGPVRTCAAGSEAGKLGCG